jgi:iron complex outermembrane receptor protein
VEAKTSGVIGSIEALPIGVAIGTQATFQKYSDDFDAKSVNNEVFGNAGSSGGGHRDTTAAYLEFSIPLTHDLELQVADRYDHYSDFGDAQNPKLGLLYHVTPAVLVRASVGTGFKAPLMQDLYAASSNGYPTFIDHVACNAERQAGGATPECNPQQYLVTSSGNKNLDAEKSISYNAGVVYEPTNTFNISLDGFLTKNKNVVGIDYDDATLAESKGTNLADYGVIVTRDSSGVIDNIVAPLQNLSSQEIAGLDLSTSYTIHRVKLSMEHSQLLYFKEEGFPGAGLRDKLGENGRPAWRNATSIAYMLSDHDDIALTALTTAGQKNAVEGTGRLNDYTELEMRYAFRTKTIGEFSLMIKNLLGTTPPLDTSSPNAQLNQTIYDQIGRQLIAGYKVNF